MEAGNSGVMKSAHVGLILLSFLGGSAGCDCHECDPWLEVVNAQTGEPVTDAEAVVALTAYGRRFPLEGRSLEPGTYRLWVRAPGFRQVTEWVDIETACEDFESGECNGAYTVALEPRS